MGLACFINLPPPQNQKLNVDFVCVCVCVLSCCVTWHKKRSYSNGNSVIL